MKTILIVGSNKLTIPILDICRQKKLKIIITDKNINDVNKKYADEFFQVNGLDKEKILEICKKNNVDGILTLGEDRLETIAYVSENMNIPGITRMTAIYSQNKFLLREKMKQNGIPVPFYCTVKNKEELNKLNIQEIEFPVVMKPIDATGSRGVIKVNDKFRLERALTESLESSKNGVVMIEEYLSGKEYSVETLTQNGKTYVVSITEKTILGDPYFVETRHIVPAKLNDVDRKK
ncbi:ATP-grasp domain-containing protein [Clostridium tagluense]|uniref:ATP-grasp domain-containing protein n=1 Tax=Clostridium tagluense TaxID=360422 RepID=A0A401UHP5_9CLOT|nr:ATP-grasp domain-containing protein [Clostridium tagluense]GCD08999.1 hypothetical protein Ctaglu_06220 [Clostridium tagluense]